MRRTERKLDRVKAVAFDLDGALYLGDLVVPGAADAVAGVRASGRRALFVTNASGRTRGQITARLRSLGVAADERDVFSSAAAAGRWVADTGLHDVWATGAPGLRRELEAEGARLIDEDGKPQAVVIGLDRERSLESGGRVLPDRIAAAVSRRECRLVACNRDMTYPGPDGALHPGCGQVVARVEAQCGRVADAVVGKPEPYLLLLAASAHRLAIQDVLVVGDSWTSDVGMARRCGCPWAFVTAPGQPTGEVPQECADDPVGRVLDSVADVPSLFTVRGRQGREPGNQEGTDDHPGEEGGSHGGAH